MFNCGNPGVVSKIEEKFSHQDSKTQRSIGQLIFKNQISSLWLGVSA